MSNRKAVETKKKSKKLPVGVSDFKEMIQGNFYYVDQSLFIKEVLDKGDKILLIPRPRRFGKTLNLSMLRFFFDCCPGIMGKKKENTGDTYKALFDSLAISKAGREYNDHMGKYPVIFLSFKDIKERDWETCQDKMNQLIIDEYSKHYYLFTSDILVPPEKDYFERIVSKKGSKADYEGSLGKLLSFLHRFYNERGVILIDEYDAPVHAGYQYGYYDEVINFMRNFFSGGLKDTGQYLEKSVITGIMRIAKESIFSGLNNPGVYTLVSTEFSGYFGFTGEEVEILLKNFGLSHMYNKVQEWYNGYSFGKKTIYNPWSIINFLASEENELKPYWIHTADNGIIEDILSDGGKELKKELEMLINGETIEKVIEENIVMKNIKTQENLLWSFLLMGGYLKYTSKRQDEITGRFYYQLAIPNKEVKTIYYSIVENYFSTKIENKKLNLMLTALVEGDFKLFERMLQAIVLSLFSYRDFGDEPESVYHALVTGFLVWLSNTHEVKSNRESGYGRYDIMIIPRDTTRTGYIIEFKTVDTYENETAEAALDAAIKQIEDKKYETELIARNIKDIKKVAIAFKGKDVFVKESTSL